ncbi:MAG: hypothetical protein VW169_16170, partial [Rhodospirillaceae bacterium]
MNQQTNELQKQLEPVINQIIEIMTTYGLDILGAIAILIIGFWISGRAGAFVGRMLEKHDKIDATLTYFFASFVRCALLAVTVIAVLGQFGVQTASLITVLGAAGQAGTIKELNLFFTVMAT